MGNNLSQEEALCQDLIDEEWKIVKPLLLPKRKGRGRSIELDMRDVLSAILYVVRSSCQWENLPKDFPNHNSVYYHHRKRCRDGIWRQISTILRKPDRRERGRDEDPKA